MVVELKHFLIRPVYRFALVWDLNTVFVQEAVDLVDVDVLKVL